jgi:hypothetical protein
MAYREFYNVGDTRPLPSGFATGFKPDIPTAAEVEAVRQKKIAEDQKKVGTIFDNITQAEAGYLSQQQQMINELRPKALDEFYKQGKFNPETTQAIQAIDNFGIRTKDDVAVLKNFVSTMPYKDFVGNEVNKAIVQYNNTPITQRQPAQQFADEVTRNLYKYADPSAIVEEYKKNAKKTTTQTEQSSMVDGSGTKTTKLTKGTVVDDAAVGQMFEMPLAKQAFDFKRQAKDQEIVLGLFKGKGNVSASVVVDGLEGPTRQTIEYKPEQAEELATLVAQGKAVPLDSSGNPILDPSTDVRTFNFAKKYLQNSLDVENRTSIERKVDTEKAPQSSFLGKRTLNPDVSLEQSTIQSNNADGNLLIEALMTGQDLPDAQYNDRPFIATSINTKDGVQPVTIKNSTFKLANSPDNITGNLDVNGFTPVFFDAEGKVVVAPSNFTEQQKIDFYKTKKGLREGLLMVGVVEDINNIKSQVVVEVQNSTDPNFVNFNKRTTNKQAAKDVFNGFVRLNPDAPLLNKVNNTKAFTATGLTKKGTHNKPKVKRKL